jgi:hypothetical protein
MSIHTDGIRQNGVDKQVHACGIRWITFFVVAATRASGCSVAGACVQYKERSVAVVPMVSTNDRPEKVNVKTGRVSPVRVIRQYMTRHGAIVVAIISVRSLIINKKRKIAAYRRSRHAAIQDFRAGWLRFETAQNNEELIGPHLAFGDGIRSLRNNSDNDILVFARGFVEL